VAQDDVETLTKRAKRQGTDRRAFGQPVTLDAVAQALGASKGLTEIQFRAVRSGRPSAPPADRRGSVSEPVGL
jgi:hypothetical protein